MKNFKMQANCLFQSREMSYNRMMICVLVITLNNVFKRSRREVSNALILLITSMVSVIMPFWNRKTLIAWIRHNLILIVVTSESRERKTTVTFRRWCYRRGRVNDRFKVCLILSCHLKVRGRKQIMFHMTKISDKWANSLMNNRQ